MSKLRGNVEATSGLLETIGPVNIQAERAVLSSIIDNPHALMFSQEALTPDCFYDSFNRNLYSAILSIARKNTPIAPATIYDELLRDGIRFELQSIFELAQEYSPSGEYFEVQCKILIRNAKQRKLIAILQKKLQLLLLAPLDTTEDIDFLLAEVGAELQQGMPERANFVDYNKAVADNLADGVHRRGLMTGHVDLDRHIDLRPGQIMTIYGDTGHKKTTLALNLAVRWARTAKIIYYSTEQKPSDLAKIAYDIEGETDPTITEGNFLFLDKPPIVELLMPQVKLLKARSGLDVVFIDYLQDLNTNQAKYYRDETPRISYFVQAIKDLALRENVAIVVVSQMRKKEGDAVDNSANPAIDRMRGSGDIKMASSIILSVVNPKKLGMERLEEMSTENMLVLRIKRNRDCLSGDPGEERRVIVFNAPNSRKINSFSFRRES